jgi:hypothetical protein
MNLRNTVNLLIDAIAIARCSMGNKATQILAMSDVRKLTILFVRCPLSPDCKSHADGQPASSSAPNSFSRRHWHVTSRMGA